MEQICQTHLSPRQMQSLKLIANWRKSRCYSITIQELATSLGTSRTTAFEHVEGLREKGLLSGQCGRARSLSITAKARRLLKESRSAEESSGEQSTTEDIPLLGRIAAGEPIEAIENVERISLSSEFGNTQDTFALAVVGSSMIGDGIFDGDYVVCKRAQTAENGKIVAAIVDEENATVKRFFKEQDRVRLEPANPEFKPIYTRNCKIAGVVVGLMRKI